MNLKIRSRPKLRLITAQLVRQHFFQHEGPEAAPIKHPLHFALSSSSFILSVVIFYKVYIWLFIWSWPHVLLHPKIQYWPWISLARDMEEVVEVQDYKVKRGWLLTIGLDCTDCGTTCCLRSMSWVEVKILAAVWPETKHILRSSTTVFTIFLPVVEKGRSMRRRKDTAGVSSASKQTSLSQLCYVVWLPAAKYCQIAKMLSWQKYLTCAVLSCFKESDTKELYNLYGEGLPPFAP